MQIYLHSGKKCAWKPQFGDTEVVIEHRNQMPRNILEAFCINLIHQNIPALPGLHRAGASFGYCGQTSYRPSHMPPLPSECILCISYGLKMGKCLCI